MQERQFFLSAVLGRKSGSPQVLTTAFSRENLHVMLQGEPAAITVGPWGTSLPERLLDAFGRLAEPTQSGRTYRNSLWRYYTVRSEEIPHFERLVDSADLTHLDAWIATDPTLYLAFIRDSAASRTSESAIAEGLMPRLVRVRNLLRAVAAEQENRTALQVVHAQMLEQVETYTSEQLARVADSNSCNASGFAKDLRDAGRILGVRRGNEWLYPRFQFDHTQRPVRPFVQMKAVLAALPEDKRGWDRLQWFLESNTLLNERTPLEVWRADRDQVVESANAGRPDERD
jgi:hypothetical protein